MGEKTQRNLYEAFVGEAKAHRRLLAFARKAEEEGYPDVARLFRAVAYAEGIHADMVLRLLGEAVVRSTEENLQSSFERERFASGIAYARFIQEAEEEGDRRAAFSSSVGHGTWRRPTRPSTNGPSVACSGRSPAPTTSATSAATLWKGTPRMNAPSVGRSGKSSCG